MRPAAVIAAGVTLLEAGTIVWAAAIGDDAAVARGVVYTAVCACFLVVVIFHDPR